MVALWEKLKFWKKTSNQFKEGVDYKFVDTEGSDLTALRILRGRFSGVVYYYTGVRISEENGMAKLSFGYAILETGKYDENYLYDSDEFDTLMGDILKELILKEEVYEQTRTFDTEELDL